MDTIELYSADGGSTSIEVRLNGETVWLTQQQIADLFETSRENITMHLKNIYSEGELVEQATRKEFLQVRQEGSRKVSRRVAHYNLDAIISVGYRVKSRIATKFRIWATERLRAYLVAGYAVNEERLAQLGSIVNVLSRANDEMVAGVVDVLSVYLPGITLLREFDEGDIASSATSVPNWTLTIEEARSVIARLAREFPADRLLGRERGNQLESVVNAIYQGFGDVELYPTVEEKAANLLYFIVKDHPLADGNKPSAAALFIVFLERNALLLGREGRLRIDSNTLAAVTLLVALSDPAEKELMIALIIRMLTPVVDGSNYEE